MNKYKHIFFDLDRTLWDFEQNSITTLKEMFQKNNLLELGVESFDEFFSVYKKINHGLWTDYKDGKIKKDFLSFERFNKTLVHFGIENKDLAKTLSIDYITISPMQTKLFPYTFEILDYLKSKNYSLHIITNGFKEVQKVKLKNSKLQNYFDLIIISEEVGFKKPSPEIFEISIEKAKAKKEECIMIGDDLETDIKGALAANTDAIWVNFNDEKNIFENVIEVNSLKELQDIL
jgi:putative hydrolase of the HAD superfamily